MVRLTFIIFFQSRQGQGRGKEQGLCWAKWGRKAEVKKKINQYINIFLFSIKSVMCYVLICVLCYVGHSAPSSPRRQPLLHLDCKIAFVLHKDQGSRISLNIHHLCRKGHQQLLKPFESSFAFYFWRRESRRGEADQVFVQRLGNFFLSKLWPRGRVTLDSYPRYFRSTPFMGES